MARVRGLTKRRQADRTMDRMTVTDSAPSSRHRCHTDDDSFLPRFRLRQNLCWLLPYTNENSAHKSRCRL